MNMHGSRFLGFLFWVTYLVAAVACWLTTYQVFVKSDTPLVAGLAAASIDGVLALNLYLMGRTRHQDQKTTSLIGTIVFGVFSGFAQVVHRFDGMGISMPQWMQIVSLFLLPASTTGGLILLGIIKYFSTQSSGGQGGGNSNQQRGNQQNQRQNVMSPELPEPFRVMSPERQGQFPVGQVAVPERVHVPTNGNGRKFDNSEAPFPKLVSRDNVPADPTSTRP